MIYIDEKPPTVVARGPRARRRDADRRAVLRRADPRRRSRLSRRQARAIIKRQELDAKKATQDADGELTGTSPTC